MIVDLLVELFEWIWKLWSKLDEKTKHQIIDSIVSSFQDLLRGFYRQWKDSKGEGESEQL